MKRLSLALAPFVVALLLAASSAIAADPPAAGEKAPAFSLSSQEGAAVTLDQKDRKSTRLNSSHANISYALSCARKKRNGALESWRRHASARGRSSPGISSLS